MATHPSRNSCQRLPAPKPCIIIAVGAVRGGASEEEYYREKTMDAPMCMQKRDHLWEAACALFNHTGRNGMKSLIRCSVSLARPSRSLLTALSWLAT